MIIEQKATASNITGKVKKKISIRGLFILSCLWLAIFITALTLIVNLFRPQWEKITSNVQSLISNDWQIPTNINSVLLESENKNSLVSQEATKSSLETIDVDFIEGLVKAILTASESAQTASATAKIK
jgi:hypothetical protein